MEGFTEGELGRPWPLQVSQVAELLLAIRTQPFCQAVNGGESESDCSSHPWRSRAGCNNMLC